MGCPATFYSDRQVFAGECSCVPLWDGGRGSAALNVGWSFLVRDGLEAGVRDDATAFRARDRAKQRAPSSRFALPVPIAAE